MRKPILLAAIVLFPLAAFAQIPLAVHVEILKAEDALRYDEKVESLFKHRDPRVRTRAALAAGRIGDPAAVTPLIRLLEGDPSRKVREMAAFALGETESIDAADVIIRTLGETARARMPNEEPANVRGRLVEAAGKIAAANAQDPKAKKLGETVVFILAAEKMNPTSPETIRLALTAALRARPEGAEDGIRFFLGHTDPNIVADALNALARLRAKNANRDARDLLATNTHALVRANAARVLGAAEDKEAVDLLIKAATNDVDGRVRVSAIRSLALLRDQKAAEPLMNRGEVLLEGYKRSKKPSFIPNEHSELLEIAAALGRLLPNSENQRTDNLLGAFADIDKGHSPEIYLARVRIWQRRNDSKDEPELNHWRQFRSLAQIVGEFALIEPTSDIGKQMRSEAPGVIRPLAKLYATVDPEEENTLAAPDVLRAFARFKTEDLGSVLRDALKSKDIFVRAAAADLISELPASQENISALRSAFEYARVNDVSYNDAILSTVDALIKLDRVGSMETWAKALISPDHLVRRRVRDEVPEDIRKITSKELLYQVNQPLGPGSRMGQVLNTDADYRRAAGRRNGTVKAVLTTEKGTFTIDLLPENAPLTVDNFIKLARAKYFNGLEVHRVVPNFVMQDGDPRGDGNGGPGWSIRCEINMVRYDRGVVGMALSGKDTGGSQWFVTHSPQPHLDGGYTVFGRVNETAMKVVDNIVRGDKVASVRIIGL